MLDNSPVSQGREFHDKLDAEALLATLSEAQTTVRSYDNKAQIVGLGYIFALGIVMKNGDTVPVPVDFAGWYVFAGWLIVVVPIIMFATVLYPSRVDKIVKKRGRGGAFGAMYFDPRKFSDTQVYIDALSGADWPCEVAFEITKVSEIRDIKRRRFLRALFWAGGSFFLLFATQMSRATGMFTP